MKTVLSVVGDHGTYTTEGAASIYSDKSRIHVYSPDGDDIGQIYCSLRVTNTSHGSSEPITGYRWRDSSSYPRIRYSSRVYRTQLDAVSALVHRYERMTVESDVPSGDLDPLFALCDQSDDDYQEAVWNPRYENGLIVESDEDGYVLRQSVIVSINLATDEPTREIRWFAYPDMSPAEDDRRIGRVYSGYSSRNGALHALNDYWRSRH